MRHATSFSTLTTATALHAYAAVAILNFCDATATALHAYAAAAILNFGDIDDVACNCEHMQQQVFQRETGGFCA
jgi:hypothetical protein